MTLNLPTLAEMDAERRGKPIPKGASRLQDTQAQKKLDVIDERKFKTDVWTRDKGRCRQCGRKVVKGLARIPERGEVHHLHGREGDLRFESRCAMLACLSCHEKLTGKVNEKWIVVGTTFWMLHGQKVISANAKLKFERVA